MEARQLVYPFDLSFRVVKTDLFLKFDDETAIRGR